MATQSASKVACPVGYIGEPITISISKAASNFTHSLYYHVVGTKNGLKVDYYEYPIVENTKASSITWTVPEEFYTYIPNRNKLYGNILCMTYDGDTYVGNYLLEHTILVKEDTSKPVLSNFVVKEINSDILTLTGDENVFVKGEGMAEYSVEIAPRNSATIVDQYIQNGSKKISGLTQGIIDDVDSGTFTYVAVDSRGFTSTATLTKTLIDYLKPTCYQEITTELDSENETNAKVNLFVKGAYFHGSFGAVDNKLKIEVRHTQNDGTMGEWVELTDGLVPVITKNGYELDITISGFDYRQAYTFQCRATDKLYFVETAQYTVKVLPVFDWSEEEINFNVPIGMNNKGTILRHNAEANNTVLSGTGGHIYLRPGGTDDTSGETIIYPNGDVKFGGAVSFNDTKADFVIETSTEPMGTNGTWYWEKWASGKAVCWGTRNFGKVSCDTAMTGRSLYQSDLLSQDLPSSLFITKPSFTMVNWACGADWGETDTVVFKEIAGKSSITFCLGNTTNTILPSSYVSFYVIGQWK